MWRENCAAAGRPEKVRGGAGGGIAFTGRRAGGGQGLGRLRFASLGLFEGLGGRKGDSGLAIGGRGGFLGFEFFSGADVVDAVFVSHGILAHEAKLGEDRAAALVGHFGRSFDALVGGVALFDEPKGVFTLVGKFHDNAPVLVLGALCA